MTSDDVLEFFEGWRLHIGDGVGDWCSGHDDKTMREAADDLAKIVAAAEAEEREACRLAAHFAPEPEPTTDEELAHYDAPTTYRLGVNRGRSLAAGAIAARGQVGGSAMGGGEIPGG